MEDDAEYSASDPQTTSIESLFGDTMQTCMNLELSGIDNEQLSAMAAALSTNVSVTSINLSYNASLSDESLGVLAHGLAQNRSVCSLNLSGCSTITDPGAATFLKALSSHEQLRTFNFTGCAGVGDRLAEQFAAALTATSPGRLCVNEVFLSGCRLLSDDGMCAIAHALRRAPTTDLTLLAFQGCVHVTDVGVTALAAALSCGPNLRSLDLSWCEALTDLSGVALADALNENRHLSHLRLVCCVGLTDDTARAVARMLEVNNKLELLDLSWTKIGELGVEVLAQAMTKNRAVTTLNLSGCRGPDVADKRGRRGPVADGTLGNGNSGGIRGPDTARLSASLAQLTTLLQRNRRKPTSLAASARARRDGEFVEDEAEGRSRRSLRSTTDMLRTLKAAVTNGAAIYNANDADGCLRLFMQTAESIVVYNRTPAIVNALYSIRGHESPKTVQEQIWLLRCAFDDVIDNEDSEASKL